MRTRRHLIDCTALIVVGATQHAQSLFCYFFLFFFDETENEKEESERYHRKKITPPDRAIISEATHAMVSRADNRLHEKIG